MCAESPGLPPSKNLLWYRGFLIGDGSYKAAAEVWSMSEAPAVLALSRGPVMLWGLPSLPASHPHTLGCPILPSHPVKSHISSPAPLCNPPTTGTIPIETCSPLLPSALLTCPLPPQLPHSRWGLPLILQPPPHTPGYHGSCVLEQSPQPLMLFHAAPLFSSPCSGP